MEILSSCSCVHTTIWMPHMDTNKMHREKGRWELHKNDVHCLKQILKATLARLAVQPPAFHFINHSSKM